jgi:regulatory protein
MRVRAQLRQIGLAADLVEASIAAYPDWIEQVQAARKKKFGAALPAHYPDKQRQSRFLAYRGFTSAQIRNALGFDIDINDENEGL